MHKKFLLDTSAYEELKLDSLPECIELYSTATAQRELLDTSRDFLRRTLVDKYEVAHDATVPKTFLYKYHMNVKCVIDKCSTHVCFYYFVSLYGNITLVRLTCNELEFSF